MLFSGNLNFEATVLALLPLGESLGPVPSRAQGSEVPFVCPLVFICIKENRSTVQSDTYESNLGRKSFLVLRLPFISFRHLFVGV